MTLAQSLRETCPSNVSCFQVNLTIEEVGLRLASGSLRGVQAMPACEAAAHEAAFHGVPVAATDTGVQVGRLLLLLLCHAMMV